MSGPEAHEEQEDVKIETGESEPFTKDKAKELLGDTLKAKDPSVHRFLQGELMKSLKNGSEEDLQAFGEAAAELAKENEGAGGEFEERMEQWGAVMQKVQEERS